MIRINADNRAAIIRKVTFTIEGVTATIAIHRDGPAARDRGDTPIETTTIALPVPSEEIDELRQDLVAALVAGGRGDQKTLPTMTGATALQDNTGVLLPDGKVSLVDTSVIEDAGLSVVLRIWPDQDSIGEGWPLDQHRLMIERDDDWLAATMAKAYAITAAVIGGQVV